MSMNGIFAVHAVQIFFGILNKEKQLIREMRNKSLFLVLLIILILWLLYYRIFGLYL